MGNFDQETRLALEEFARRIDRRGFLKRASMTLFAAAAATALGSLANATRVYASHAACQCHPPNGVYCSGCPSTTEGGCPSGCSVCTSSSGCSLAKCPYSSGNWSSCGCGICGAGCVVCYDCKCPGCSNICGCVSTCLCCNCCGPQAIAEEMERIARERRAAA